MNRVVFITGASGGIGRATALVMAQDGWDVILHYNENKAAAESAAEAVRSCGRQASLVQADLSTIHGITEAESALSFASAVVFTAGMSQYSLIQDVTPEEMDRLWHVHLKAPMQLCRRAADLLRPKTNASITFVSSIWGETGAACETVYSAVKGGQQAFAKALAKELGPSGIRVNSVAPGMVDTPMNHSFTDQEKSEIESDIPLGRIADPTEVAQAVRFLASPEASYITGHTLSINGGWYA